MYHLYFENDLQYVKERTEEQVSTYRHRLDANFSVIDAIKLENVQLKRLIKTCRARIALHEKGIPLNNGVSQKKLVNQQ